MDNSIRLLLQQTFFEPSGSPGPQLPKLTAETIGKVHGSITSSFGLRFPQLPFSELGERSHPDNKDPTIEAAYGQTCLARGLVFVALGRLAPTPCQALGTHVDASADCAVKSHLMSRTTSKQGMFNLRKCLRRVARLPNFNISPCKTHRYQRLDL